MSNPIYSNNDIKPVMGFSYRKVSFVIILIILFCVAVSFLGVSFLNNTEMRKFEGSWENESTSIIFMSNGDLRYGENGNYKNCTYSVEKGHLFIHYGEDTPLRKGTSDEFVYYFSSDGQILELHWLIGDGFTTLTRVK